MSEVIKIGEGAYSARIAIGDVIHEDTGGVMFDITTLGPSAGVTDITQSQAGEVIDALLEAFPGLGALVPPPAPPELKDPITEWYSKAENHREVPTVAVIQLRVAGEDIVAINAMDTQGFAVHRAKTPLSRGYSKTLGYIHPSVYPEGWAVELPGLRTAHQSAIAAIKHLLTATKENE